MQAALRKIFFFLMLLPSSVYGEVLHIAIQEPKGGGGDVVANLLMADLLQKERRSATIDLIFDPDDAEMTRIIKFVCPGFDPKITDLQEIDGLRFYALRSRKLPKPDALITFSIVSENPAYGRLTIAYTEFNINVPVGDKIAFRGRIPQILPSSDLAFPVISTGMNDTGLYIHRRKPHPVARDILVDQLEALTKAKRILVADDIDFRRAALTICYTKEAETAYRYLEAIALLAETPGYKDRQIVVFLNKDIGFSQPRLPSNVKVAHMKGLPLRMFEGILDNVSIPPLVRGDNSVSQAIDRAVPFFYEMSAWKDGFASRLTQMLLTLSGLPESKLVSWLMIAEQRPDTTAKDFLDLMLDVHSQQALRHAVTRLREGHTLAPRVWLHLDALKMLTRKISVWSEILLINLADLGLKGDDLLATLRSLARNDPTIRATSAERVAALEILSALPGVMHSETISAAKAVFDDFYRLKDPLLNSCFKDLLAYWMQQNPNESFWNPQQPFWHLLQLYIDEKQISIDEFHSVKWQLADAGYSFPERPSKEWRSVIQDTSRSLQERIDALVAWVDSDWDDDDVAFFEQLILSAADGRLGVFRAQFDNFIATEMMTLKVRTLLAHSVHSSDASLRHAAERLFELILNLTDEADFEGYRSTAANLLKSLPDCPQSLLGRANASLRPAIGF